MKKLMLLGAALLSIACSTTVRNTEIAIIPSPVSIEKGSGKFILGSPINISYPKGDATLEKAANFYAATLTERLGATVNVTTKEVKGGIVLENSNNITKAEGYKLNIEGDQIQIDANDYSGAVYALQTLLQLMPTEVYSSGQILKGKNIVLPEVEIYDFPRFAYRGMHLDCVRHFFTADSVKRYLDYMAMNKLNRFHWHLTDDQGWRMESKKYPLLNEKSAWRIDRSSQDWDNRTPIDRAKGEKPTYGGFYTQHQIRDIVAYAAKRGIAVIPEIETPGHSSAVFAAYPNLSCLGHEQEVTPGGYYPKDLATCYCAGNEDVFTFLEGILSETIELFPDAPYIHIGGDEVDWRFWSECPKCQARMKAENLKTTAELQSYFIKRIEKFVNSKGKNIIGWDEILEGGLTPNATVMSWRGIAGGIEAARQGHDVVMTPNSHLYFDYYQNTPSSESKTIGGLITTKNVYGYEPIPEALTADEAKHVLGAQANLWAEFITDFKGVERMVLPRMSALAEVVWSPAEDKDWEDFSRRLDVNAMRLGAMGANYHKGSEIVEITTAYDSLAKKFMVNLVSEIYMSDIHYTIDGSQPSINSTKYTGPIAIDNTATVKAVIVKNGQQISRVPSDRTIGMHKGVGKKVIYNKQPADAYLGTVGEATLVDGLTGSTRHNDGFLQGFNNEDFDIIIDMGDRETINSVEGSFLQSVGTWVYLPTEMVVSMSDDMKTWKEAGRATHSIDPRTTQVVRHTFRVDPKTDARYIRIIGVNKETEKGLPGEGTINWIFADEIFIN